MKYIKTRRVKILVKALAKVIIYKLNIIIINRIEEDNKKTKDIKIN